MQKPKLFRITASDLYHGSGRRLGKTMKLDRHGTRTVAFPEKVHGQTWKDIAGDGVLLYSTNSHSVSFRGIVLTRRCVERFVGTDDLVIDVELGHIRPQGKRVGSSVSLDYVALVPHGGVNFSKAMCRYDMLQQNNFTHYALTSTWDGTNYVMDRDLQLDFTCCSLHILETARAERWSGLEFHPADLPFGLQALWGGIDYLSEQWPPRRWYPPDPTTFTGVADWVAALDEVGDRAGRWVTLMMREFDEWASQDALDWIAAYITDREPGTQTVDYAARVYMYCSQRHADRFRFDPVALERAHEINVQIRSLGLAALRKRYKRR